MRGAIKMKRFLRGTIIIVIMILGCEIIGQVFIKKADTKMTEDISEKIIRFHVLANSDTKDDQELKLKVKDEIIKFIQPKLSESKSIEESREILLKNDEEIKKIADKIIKDNGYSYEVKTELQKENFPVKQYGDIVLPQGEYEAYRVLIGDYKGQNWWCVMFPPLCFVDVTKGQIENEKTKEELESVLDKNEMEMVCDNKDNIKVKSKVFEVIKELIEK